tara:strand:+ start:144 stop:821 length:678 start_codon:yes stop_codon:yes gene_type:complete
MKKIALCVHDFSISTFSIFAFRDAYWNIIKNLMYNNDFHLFIHIWEPTDERQLKNIKLKTIDKLVDIYKPEYYKVENNNFSNANQEHWYSHNAVLELVNDYSNKNNIQYDLVFITKPDCNFTTKLNLDKMNIENTLYVSNWEKKYGIVTEDYLKSKGLCYYWCFGNMNLINKLKNVKNYINSQESIQNNFYKYIVNNNISYTPIFFFNDDYSILRHLRAQNDLRD